MYIPKHNTNISLLDYYRLFREVQQVKRELRVEATVTQLELF